MKESHQQAADRIMEEVSMIIDSGVWSCIPTHLHLVPEKNIDKAVFFVSIFMLESLIDELTEEGRISKANHFIEIKKIIQDKKNKIWQ
jgi:hypothetical protein